MNDRCMLMRKIAENYFALADIHLYCDTHPADASLDGKINELLRETKELVSRYEANFGPLTCHAGTAKQWLASPWPWEIDKEA
ncbi:MAG: spore coat protein CotJB [Clostridia bacterium]|nr:spore coat protein CotJB [Clostridia bacterium]